MKTILIVCATGLVISTAISNEIHSLLESSQIQANIVQCKANDIAKNIEKAHLIVSAIHLKETYPIPTINAMPILSGRNKTDVEGEILAYMKQ